MIQMNNDLQIGQPAIIIGCHHPENSWVIGRTVTVVDFIDKGAKLPDVYLKNGNPFDTVATAHLAVIVGIGTHAELVDKHAFIQRKYLMPIPPLGDVYDQEMMDEMENHKVSA